MQRERFDLLLTIDYNLGYSVYLRSLPRTPTIVWVRDPRTPEDAERIRAVRLPGDDVTVPQGLMSHDGRSLYTANGTSHDLSLVNPITGNVDQRVHLGGLPWGVVVGP